MSPPTAPSTLPQYIADGLPKQDDETLRDTQDYIDQLLTERERITVQKPSKSAG